MKKFLIVFGVLAAITIAGTAAAAKTNQPNGQPFQEVWTAVNEIQENLNNPEWWVESFFDIFIPREEHDGDTDALQAQINDLQTQLNALQATCADCCNQPVCSPEICDSADNDCDDAIDEGLGGEACTTGLLGICSDGIMVCAGESGLSCEPLNMPLAEVCNGIDDDCDGLIDEGLGVAEGCGSCVDLDNPATWGNKVEYSSEYKHYNIKDDVLLCAKTYNLGENNIEVYRNNILNCDGSIIVGAGPISGTAAGIRLDCHDTTPYTPCIANITVMNCNVENYNVGIKANMVDYVTVENSTATGNNYGFIFRGVQESVMRNNQAMDNVYSGIEAIQGHGTRRVNNNEVYNNTSANSGGYGFKLVYGADNEIYSNTVYGSGSYGIYVYESHDNNIYNNSFTNTNNGYSGSYTADFTNNWNIAKTLGVNIVGGPYLGGNYWSDYAGSDLDADGLGDTDLPYDSGGDITDGGDNLPLVD